MRLSGDSLEVGDLELDTDPKYIQFIRDLSYEEYQLSHVTPEARAARPFCEKCFNGHSTELTCNEVAELMAADREFGSGPY